MYFRGMNDKSYPIKSSFDRARESAKPLVRAKWMYEIALLREFKRKAHQYISDTPDNRDNLEWLALMRHYGAPTRLVDFTYSHYIASYFAFHSLGCEDKVVWAIEREWLNDEATRRCSAFLEIQEDKLDLDLPEQFSKCFLWPNDRNAITRRFVAAVNADRMNTRLTVQQGFFLCPGDIEQSFEENLRSMIAENKSQKPVFKIVIPHSARNRALTELKYMNISSTTLFPDLGGFANSLNDRFELLFNDFIVSEHALLKTIAYKAENK